MLTGTSARDDVATADVKPNVCFRIWAPFSEPLMNEGGVRVGREHRVEDMLDDPVADDQR